MPPEITRSREPIGENELAELESLLGVSLPPAYRSFLLAHNGGRPKPAAFPIQNNPSDTHALVDFLLSIKEDDVYHLPTWIRRYRKRIPAELIPIGVDPGGNLILLAVTGSNTGKVFFWDHEEEAEDGQNPGYDNVYPVSDSFSEFLNSLTDL